MPRPRRASGNRAGLATTELAVVLCAVGVIGVAGAIVVPYSVRAASDGGAAVDVVPRDPELAAVRQGVLELVRSARAVLVARDEPVPELALWVSDAHGPGVVDPDEILVLRFNAAVGALAAYLREPASAPEEDPGAGGSGSAGRGVGRSPPGLPPDLVTGGVLDVWRDRPRTRRRVVAAGLEAVRVVTTPGPGGDAAVRVHLVWAPRRADEGPSEGVFEVRLPRAEVASR